MADNKHTTHFAKEVTKWRQRRGLTVRELARWAQTSPGTIHKLEHGSRQQLSLEVAVKIAQALQVTLDQLVGMQKSNGAAPPAAQEPRDG